MNNLKKRRWVCTDCYWEHRAHPNFEWSKIDDRAVEVHQTILCPKVRQENE